MGGSGGSGGIFSARTNPDRLREQAVDEAERARFATEVNGLLARELAQVNSRDVAAVSDRLDEIREGLESQGVEIEALLFGGSVAKHTYVDGLSDVDSLALLDIDSMSNVSPSAAREQLADAIRSTLGAGDVERVEVGDLAVRVTYKGGMVIELLPAVRSGEQFVIPSEDGRSWREIDPQAFSRRLTEANRKLGDALVPTIKLAKAMIAELPAAQHLTGYHVEALALAAFQDYRGPRNPAAMLEHFFRSVRSAVLHPIKDVTGQSPEVDEYLGEEFSGRRQRTAASMARVARIMESSTLIDQWRELLGSD